MERIFSFLGWVMTTYFQALAWASMLGFIFALFLIVVVGWIMGRFFRNL